MEKANVDKFTALKSLVSSLSNTSPECLLDQIDSYQTSHLLFCSALLHGFLIAVRQEVNMDL